MAERRGLSTKTFEKLYKELNTEQKKAVGAIEGPVLVIAGPGTGKTQVLTMRIANILLKTDTPSSSILALTFTDSGVKVMRERLLEIIGPEAYYVNICTFHSFCSDILKTNPDKFIVSEDLEPLSDLERVQLFRELLDEKNYKHIKPFGSSYYYVKALIKTIQDLKREGITPEKFRKFLKDYKIPDVMLNSVQHLGKIPKSRLSGTPLRRWRVLDDTQHKSLKWEAGKLQEVLDVYERYQEKLTEKSRYDFEDMINLVTEKLEKDDELLRDYQERYLYILVDEYQDTNSPQNKVVSLLTNYWGEDANVFAVGDDSQSIYRFQGASLENILFFTEKFSKAAVLVLKKNYRNQKIIIDASLELIEKNELKLSDFIHGFKKQQIPDVAHKDSKIKVGHFSSGITESFFVSQKIKELIDKGVKPHEIAVIYRNNIDSKDFSDMLGRLGINFNLVGGENVLEDHDINKLLKLFEVILKSRTKDEDLDLFTILNYEFLNFDYVDTLKLSRFSSERKINFVEAINHPDFEKLSYVKRPKKFQDFLGRLNFWQTLDANTTFVSFFEKVLEESGFLNWVLQSSDSIEKLNKLNSLFAEIKRLNIADHSLNLQKFMDDVAVLRESHIPVNEEDLNIRSNAVLLTTAHRAKGLEFEYVFIVKCFDGKWGNNKIRELIKLPEGLVGLALSFKARPRPGPLERNEDERRLFYVAMTRAKKELFVTYADSYFTEGSTREAVPSMFISEIGEDRKEEIDILKYESAVKEILKDILKPVQTSNVSVEEEDFLRSVLKNFSLSVTALNTYLECPYKFKLNNLLRTPRAKDKYLALGTAVHRALEYFFRTYKNTGKLPTANFLLSEFNKAIGEEILTEAEYKEGNHKGEVILKAYYETYRKDFVKPLFTERFFGYGAAKIYLDDIPLTGKIDKIELLNPKEKDAKVIDYKTGRPRSRNEIEGKTKNSSGDYKRQLVFYKILADLDRTFNFNVIETELDFVEADKSGKYTKESFKITPQELEELKSIIKDVVKRIRNLEFPRTTDYRVCTNCEFKDHCWPDGIPENFQQVSLSI